MSATVQSLTDTETFSDNDFFLTEARYRCIGCGELPSSLSNFVEIIWAICSIGTTLRQVSCWSNKTFVPGSYVVES